MFYGVNTTHFDVRHDWDERPNDEVHTLDNFFAGIDNVNTHYFWIDFKNLKSDNQVDAAGRLCELFDKYDINHNLKPMQIEYANALKAIIFMPFHVRTLWWSLWFIIFPKK